VKSFIRELVVRTVAQHNVRRLYALIRNTGICDQAVSVCEPGDGAVTVLAPHMDDEVLGCGGTIARHVQAGADVTVVFLTDGRLGAPPDATLSVQQRTQKQQELVEIRKQEARRAGKILGVQTIVFLDAQDMNLRAETVLVQRVRDLLNQRRPSIVYLPFFLERHPDHRAASDVLLAATAGTTLDFECRGYEVWTPLFANVLVNIDTTITVKRTALACYQSQLAHTDYLHSSIGLNAYRASAASGCRFAEAFHAARLADHRRLYQALC
jgi:N-acetylglucosamine malate deacetylase 1